MSARLTRSTSSANPQTVEKRWLLIDADGLVVGRLASLIANRLRGKHKADYTPHVDCGDNIIVINAEKVRFTGNKAKKKIYYRHTGYIGGIKQITADKILDGRFPERVLEKAVERMIPDGPLGRKQMRNLRIFKGPDHPHSAQAPSPLDIASMNPKNCAVRPRFEARNSNEADATDRHFASELSLLCMQLDSPEDEARAAALASLAAILPAPISETHFSLETSMTLRALPMRLMRSLIEEARSPEAAKAAAIALVKAQYPQHYKDASDVDEATAARDFQRIFRRHSIDYFCTFDTRKDGPMAVTVDSRLWNAFSFKLNGTHPGLGDADWIDPAVGISLKVVGAEAVESHPVADEALEPGQLAGRITQLIPQERNGKPIRVYLTSGERVLSEHVYRHSELFGGEPEVQTGIPTSARPQPVAAAGEPPSARPRPVAAAG